MLILLVPLAYLPFVFEPHITPKWGLLAVGGGLLWATLVRSLWHGPEWGLRLGAILPPLFAWIAWSALSVAWARSPFLAWDVLVPYLAALAVVLHVAWQPSSQVVGRGLVALWVAGVVNAGVGLVQLSLAPELLAHAGAPAGLMGNRNPSTHFTAIVFPIGFWCLFASRSPARAGAAAAGQALMAGYVLQAASRGGLFALIVAAAACGALLVWRGRQGVLRMDRVHRAALAGFVVALLGLMFLPSRIETAGVQVLAAKLGRLGTEAERIQRTGIGVEARDESLGGRRSTLLNSLDMVVDHPLGVGPGNWAVHFPRYLGSRVPVDRSDLSRTAIRKAHNDYVELLCEGGLPGALLAGWLGAAILATGWRVLRRLPKEGAAMDPTEPVGGWPAEDAALAGVVSLAAAALVSFPLQWPLPPLALAVALGLLVRSTTIRAAAPAPPPTRGTGLVATRVGAVLATSLALWLGWIGVQRMRTNWSFERGLTSMQAGREAEGLRWIEDAIALTPEHYEANSYLGYLLHRRDPVRALQSAERALQTYPHLANSLLLKARSLEQLERLRPALETWCEVLVLVPENAETLGSCSEVARRVGLGRCPEACVSSIDVAGS